MKKRNRIISLAVVICFVVTSIMNIAMPTYAASITTQSAVALAEAMGSGDTHGGILKDGALYTWGSNGEGQTAQDTFTTKSTVPNYVSYKYFGAKLMKYYPSKRYNIAITEGGEVFTWGSNEYGQLGLGDKAVRATPRKIDIANFGGATASISASGKTHSIIATNTGDVYTWGNNISKQLGYDTGIDTYSSVPHIVPGISRAKFVSSGAGHSVAITQDNKVFVWGENTYGQLANTDEKAVYTTPTEVVVPFVDNEVPVQLTSGDYYTLILTDKGNVYGWGNNSFGAVGCLNSANKIYVPTKVYTTAKFVQINASMRTAAGITANGELYVWGDNVYKQLGPKFVNKTYTGTPKKIEIGSQRVVSVGGGADTFIAVAENLVDNTKQDIYMWGANRGLQVDATTVELIAEPNAKVLGANDLPTNTGNTFKLKTKLPADADYSFATNVGVNDILEVCVMANDFQRLGAFAFGVDYDEKYLQLCDSAGNAYNTGIISSADVGKLFTVHSGTWPGGALLCDGNYPYLDNKNGKISIFGYKNEVYDEILNEYNTKIPAADTKLFSMYFKAIGGGGSSGVEIKPMTIVKTHNYTDPIFGVYNGSSSNMLYRWVITRGQVPTITSIIKEATSINLELFEKVGAATEWVSAGKVPRVTVEKGKKYKLVATPSPADAYLFEPIWNYSTAVEGGYWFEGLNWSTTGNEAYFNLIDDTLVSGSFSATVTPKRSYIENVIAKFDININKRTSLSGIVNPVGRGDFRGTDMTVTLDTYAPLPVNTDGTFNFYDIQEGENYTLTVAKPHYKTRVITGVFTGDKVNVGTVELFAGDIDGNNIINDEDINFFLANYFGKNQGDIGYDDGFNFYATGSNLQKIDFSDLSYLANYISKQYE